MFRFTPAHCKLCVCTDRTFLCRLPMDIADIWRTARRSDVALQAQGGCPCTGTNDIACGSRFYAQCCVFGHLCCHIPRCGGICTLFLCPVNARLWLTRELVARLLLLCAKRASCPGYATAHPRVAARRARLQAVVLVRRPARRIVGAY